MSNLLLLNHPAKLLREIKKSGTPWQGLHPCTPFPAGITPLYLVSRMVLLADRSQVTAK